MNVSRGLGDVALAKGLYKQALARYQTAERLLRSLSEAPYTADSIMVSRAGTPTGQGDTDSSNKQVNRLRTATLPSSSLTPGSRSRINPHLGSALSSLIAVQAWVHVLLGEPLDSTAVDVSATATFAGAVGYCC